MITTKIFNDHGCCVPVFEGTSEEEILAYAGNHLGWVSHGAVEGTVASFDATVEGRRIFIMVENRTWTINMTCDFKMPTKQLEEELLDAIDFACETRPEEITIKWGDVG